MKMVTSGPTTTKTAMVAFGISEMIRTMRKGFRGLVVTNSEARMAVW